MGLSPLVDALLPCTASSVLPRGLPPVPVLVLSADGQEDTRQNVLAHGASGFLAKPLDPAALVLAVEEQATA